MTRAHTTWRTLTLALFVSSLALTGCGGEEGGENIPGEIELPANAVVNVIPGEPGWRPVEPPDQSVCIGAHPGEAAFERSRLIAAEAARAAALEAERRRAAGDAGAELERDSVEGDEGDVRLGADEADAEGEPEAPQEAREEPAQEEPCTPDFLKASECIGAKAPDFLAYDFQPQSCGYGGTYGLDVFKGRVTFVALFASW